jgi:hypothetical protein
MISSVDLKLPRFRTADRAARSELAGGEMIERASGGGFPSGLLDIEKSAT